MGMQNPKQSQSQSGGDHDNDAQIQQSLAQNNEMLRQVQGEIQKNSQLLQQMGNPHPHAGQRGLPHSHPFGHHGYFNHGGGAHMAPHLHISVGGR